MYALAFLVDTIGAHSLITEPLRTQRVLPHPGHHLQTGYCELTQRMLPGSCIASRGCFNKTRYCAEDPVVVVECDYVVALSIVP